MEPPLREHQLEVGKVSVLVAIRPPRVVVQEGQEKTLSVVASRESSEEGREIDVSFDPEGVVDLVGPVPVLAAHRSRDDALSTTFRIKGVLAGEPTMISAAAGSAVALAWVDVVPVVEEPEPEPPEQFEFERDRYHVRWQKREQLTLQAPTESGLDGAAVRVTSDDPGIAVVRGTTRMDLDLERAFLIGHITVEGRTLQARGTLRAAVNGSPAECRVQVTMKDEGDPDLEIRLKPQALGSFRSTLKEEEVDGRSRLFLDVMTKHPTLSRYIGDSPDYRARTQFTGAYCCPRSLLRPSFVVSSSGNIQLSRRELMQKHFLWSFSSERPSWPRAFTASS
jgi:hypothetical protein